ncbi:MAG TPA: LuxR C-terminal-related transcriptional regulator [Acidimicrobiales bacterium]|nr:LuxR C-terminal-related transcriptional regulator [Acidimicrobiales bacterium]
MLLDPGDDTAARHEAVLARRTRSAIHRGRLLDRLVDGDDARVVLVSASAGSGKSVLLGQWVGGMERKAWAWVSHEAADDDPARFWAFILGAIARAGHHVAPDVVRTVHHSAVDTTTVATAIGRAIAGARGLRVLVVDDFHLIRDAKIVAGVALLAELLPPGFRLAIGTRIDPHLPIDRWRMRGELVELRDDDLRFEGPEADDFFARVHGLVLADADRDRLVDDTEGWAAGMHLAALALRTTPDVPALLDRFASSHRPLLDFLAGEVVDRQPAWRRRFLQVAACIRQFSPAVLDAVLRRDDSDAVLRALRRENMFLVPLDHRPGWFRFHHLFGEYLAIGLRAGDPDRARDIHRRAGEWMRDHDRPGLAIEHLCAAGEWSAALAVLEDVVIPSFNRGRRETIRRWIAAFPNDFLVAEPGRCLVAGIATAAAGDPVQSDRWFRRVLDFPADRQEGLARRALIVLTGVKVYVGDPEASIDALDRAMQPDRHGALRPYAPARGYMHAAEAQMMLGDLGAARALAERAAADPNMDDITAEVLVPSVLSLVAFREGRLREAADHAGRAVADPIGGDMGHLYATPARVTLAELAVEHGDLESGEDQAMQLRSTARDVGALSALVGTLELLATIARCRGDRDAALDHLAEGRGVARSAGMADVVVAALDAAEARIRIDDGELARAGELVAGLPVGDAAPLAARLALARGDDDGTREILDGWDVDGATPLRRRIVRELLLADATARSRPADAVRHIDRALALAEPEGFHRTILDSSDRVRHLVVDAVGRWGSGYVASLAEAIEPGRREAEKGRRSARPVDQLTPAEERVLFYLASSLTLGELASHLGVSRNTIKTHTRNLYRKLGVRSRDEAVALAGTISSP